MHVHLVSLNRISADIGAGGFILPRESVAAAQKGSTFFGSFFPDGKKEHKQRQSVAIAYGERRATRLLPLAEVVRSLLVSSSTRRRKYT